MLRQLHYLVRDRHGQEVACLLFGPAAWKVAARDEFIGWSSSRRQSRLGHLANNSRFLILPWIQTPHLASHLLAQAVRRLRVDWPARHGRPLWLVETFVETERFSGVCYRAANWLKVGQTQGRTRNDRHHLTLENLPLKRQWEQAQAHIKAQDQQCEEWQRQAHRQAAPFRRPESARNPHPGRPGREPGHAGFCRPKPGHIDEQISVKLESCPHCQGPVSEPCALTQYIEEIPVVRPHVTQLTTESGWCEHCQCEVCSTHPLQVSRITVSSPR